MTLTLLFVLFFIIIIAAGAYAFYIRRRHLHPVFSAEQKARIHVRWHQIEEQVRRGGPSHLRQAVLEADKLVDHTLQQMRVPGDTMGERLRQSSQRFSDYNGLWKAHKLRNQIVHEMDKEILSFDVKRALVRFKQALADLGVL